MKRGREKRLCEGSKKFINKKGFCKDIEEIQPSSMTYTSFALLFA